MEGYYARDLRNNFVRQENTNAGTMTIFSDLIEERELYLEKEVQRIAGRAQTNAVLRSLKIIK